MIKFRINSRKSFEKEVVKYVFTIFAEFIEEYQIKDENLELIYSNQLENIKKKNNIFCIKSNVLNQEYLYNQKNIYLKKFRTYDGIIFLPVFKSIHNEEDLLWKENWVATVFIMLTQSIDSHFKKDFSKVSWDKSWTNRLSIKIDKPLVTIIFRELIRNYLKRNNKKLELKPNPPKCEITHDVDFFSNNNIRVFYRGFKFAVNSLYLYRDYNRFFKLLIKSFKELLKPNLLKNSLDNMLLLDKSLGIKSTYFILFYKTSIKDAYYSSSFKLKSSVLEKIKKFHNDIGIHLPYFSNYRKFSESKKEKLIFENLQTNKIIKSRFHYLNFNLENYCSFLEELDIEFDYSSCYADKPGYRNLYDRPYPLWNFQENKISNVISIPTLIFDSRLEKFKIFDEAKAEINFVISNAKKYGSRFSLLWHDTQLSNFQGYLTTELYIYTIKKLQENNIILYLD